MQITIKELALLAEKLEEQCKLITIDAGSGAKQLVDTLARIGSLMAEPSYIKVTDEPVFQTIVGVDGNSSINKDLDANGCLVGIEMLL